MNAIIVTPDLDTSIQHALQHALFAQALTSRAQAKGDRYQAPMLPDHSLVRSHHGSAT